MSELLHTSRTRRNILRTARATGAALSVVLLTTGCIKLEYNGNDDAKDIVPSDVASASGSPAHELPKQPRGLPAHVTYDPHFSFLKDTYCLWKYGTRPVPLSHLDPARVRVDNRCTEGGDTETHYDKDIPVYKEPMDSGDIVTTIVDGNEVTLECYREGAMVSNLRDRSDLWVKVSSSIFKGTGWLADLTLGGGFSPGQLESIGVEPCVTRHVSHS